jgi:hypothetical protein
MGPLGGRGDTVDRARVVCPKAFFREVNSVSSEARRGRIGERARRAALRSGRTGGASRLFVEGMIDPR